MSTAIENILYRPLPKARVTTRPLALFHILILMYVVLLPIQVELVWDLRIAPADACLILALGVGAGRIRIRPRSWSFWHAGLCVAFAIGSLVSALKGGQLSRYMYLNKDLGLLLLFASYLLVTSAATDWRDVRRMIRVFVWAVVLQNMVALAAYVFSFSLGVDLPWTSYEGRRLSGLLIDANAYGGLLALAMTLCQVCADGPERLFGRWSRLFCTVTLGLGLLLTFSRSAWLGMLPLVLYLLFFRTRAMIQFAVTAGAAIAAGSVLIGDRFWPLVAAMSHRPEQVLGRFRLMDGAIAQFYEAPLVGGGIDSFREAGGVMVHNTLLWFLADMGVVGGLMFVGFVGWFFIVGWQDLRRASVQTRSIIIGLLLGHAAMFCLSMGIEAFYQRHWWLMMGLLGAVHSMVREPRRQFAPQPSAAPSEVPVARTWNRLPRGGEGQVPGEWSTAR